MILLIVIIQVTERKGTMARAPLPALAAKPERCAAFETGRSHRRGVGPVRRAGGHAGSAGLPCRCRAAPALSVLFAAACLASFRPSALCGGW